MTPERDPEMTIRIVWHTDPEPDELTFGNRANAIAFLNRKRKDPRVRKVDFLRNFSEKELALAVTP